MNRAVASGALDPQVVIIDARRGAIPRHRSWRSGRWPATTGPHPASPATTTSSPEATHDHHRDTHDHGTSTTGAVNVVDAAAQTSIGAAARELHLPTVRAESTRLAEIAHRERHTHLSCLAEVLAAEVGDRTERRRTRRINDAKFPRQKRLADFNVDAVPTIPAATLGQLAAGHYMDAGEPIVLLGDSGSGRTC